MNRLLRYGTEWYTGHSVGIGDTNLLLPFEIRVKYVVYDTLFLPVKHGVAHRPCAVHSRLMVLPPYIR